jgi:Histidine kinase-, DNA gyrase B-, and HSP90-like ATPase
MQTSETYMIGWHARVHQQCDFVLSVTSQTKRDNSGTRRSPVAYLPRWCLIPKCRDVFAATSIKAMARWLKSEGGRAHKRRYRTTALEATKSDRCKASDEISAAGVASPRSLGNTGSMAWVSIQAGQDHLEQYTKKSPIEALAELIWNGLDAEATTVDVDIEVQSMLSAGRELSYVSQITVTDNGHGIDPDKAQEQFSSLGDSWKKSLNGRTLNNKRALHGSRGRGRFLAYSLGDRVHWSSVSNFGSNLRRIEISGTKDRINGFHLDEIEELSGPSSTGTTVVIDVPQGRQGGRPGGLRGLAR